jgi:hypothetical protein
MGGGHLTLNIRHQHIFLLCNMNLVGDNYWSRCKDVNGLLLFEMGFFNVYGGGDTY